MSEKRIWARLNGTRVLGAGFLVLFLLLSLAALTAYYGFSGVPGYWSAEQQRLAAMSPRQRNAVSSAYFNRVGTQWSAGPAGATTVQELIGHRAQIQVPYDELNTWLADDGMDLLSTVGITLPQAVQGVMVDSPADGRLRITCALISGASEQIIALTFAIQVSADGTVTSELTSARAGRVPLPTQSAVDLLTQEARGEDAGLLLDMVRGTPTGPIDIPIDPGADGLRDGRLVGLEVRDDALVITRETVRRGSRQ